MKKIVITGFTIANFKEIVGISRFCREMLLRLDRILENENLEVFYAYPSNAKNIVFSPRELKNIKAVAFKKPFWAKKIFWQVWMKHSLSALAGKDAISLCLAFEYPFLKKNISFLHDIRPALTDFDSKKFQHGFGEYLKQCKKHCKTILTGSEYQAHLIANYFSRPVEEIRTIYPGWEHMNEVEADETIFKKCPYLYTGGGVL